MTDAPATPAALILAGGLALGAYQAGALGVLLEADTLAFTAVAGTSIGAINAAILAGNPADRRVERLRAFWTDHARGTVPETLLNGLSLDPLGLGSTGRLRHARNWVDVLATRVGGVPGLFAPALGLTGRRSEVPSLYQQGGLERTLSRFVDFDLLNAGPLRCCIVTTDVETAETVVFDTAAGDRIEVAHLLASGALMPNFQPVRIGKRLLADGGLSANAPLEPILAGRDPPPPLCFLLDLFPPDGTVPTSLESAAARASEVQFAAQTRLRLEAMQREWALKTDLAVQRGDAAASADLFHLSYRAGPDAAGPEKQFDFSAATIADRIDAGAADARAALAAADRLPGAARPGLRVHPIR